MIAPVIRDYCRPGGTTFRPAGRLAPAARTEGPPAPRARASGRLPAGRMVRRKNSAALVTSSALSRNRLRDESRVRLEELERPADSRVPNPHAARDGPPARRIPMKKLVAAALMLALSFAAPALSEEKAPA